MHNNLLVLQSDFGLVDGAVSAMIGVALEESPTLKMFRWSIRGSVPNERVW